MCSLVMVAALAAPAAASPRVMVDVDGDDTGLVRRKVKGSLGEHEIDRQLIVYGTLEKAGNKVKIRLTVTDKDGNVLGELRVEAATREAAAARAGKKIWSAIKLPPAKKGGARPAVAAKKAPAPAAKKAPAPAAKETPAPAAKKAPPPAAAKPAAKKLKEVPPARPAPEEESEPEEESGSEEPESEESASASDDGIDMSVPGPSAASDQSWLSVSAGPELVGRHFTYRDDVFMGLRQYDLAGAAALGVTAGAYPLRQRTDWLGGLGAAARLWYVRPFDSDATNGETYRSTTHGWQLGARWRRTIAGIEVAGALDLGSQSFNVDAAGSEYESMVPAVSYRYLRPGVSGRMPFMGRYAAELALGYRHVLGSGEISSDAYFPRLGARGFDVEAQLTYALPWYDLDVRAGAGLEQYGFDFNPEPGDARVAGGATDRYPRLFLRVGYTR
jgi:hypothetical protein